MPEGENVEFAPSPLPPIPRPLRPFSTASIATGLIVLLGLLCLNYWSLLTQPALARHWYAADTTLQVADRMLAFQVVREQFPEPLRFQCQPLDHRRDLDAYARQALIACDGFLDGSSGRTADVRVVTMLAVLEFEQGRTNDAVKRLDRVTQLAGGTTAAERIHSAYASPPMPVNEGDAYETASVLPADWVYPTLQARFAESRGDATLASQWRDSIGGETLRRLQGFQLLNLLGNLALLGGLIAVVDCWRRPPAITPLPGEWTLQEGLGIFVWGEVLGQAVSYTCATIPFAPLNQLLLLHSFLVGLPMVALVHWRLCRLPGLSLASVFGLQTTWTTFRAALILMLVQTLAGLVLFSVMERLGPTVSVLEGLDEALLWGNTVQRVGVMLDATLGAGFFEEVACRGVLFLALRRWCGFFGAAAISSAVFAGLHFYGWMGFVSVGIFGFLQAWSVERTQSLMPAVIVHATSNFFYFGWDLLLYS